MLRELAGLAIAPKRSSATPKRSGARSPPTKCASSTPSPVMPAPSTSVSTAPACRRAKARSRAAVASSPTAPPRPARPSSRSCGRPTPATRRAAPCVTQGLPPTTPLSRPSSIPTPSPYVRPAHHPRGRAPRLRHRAAPCHPRRRRAVDLELRRRALPRRHPDRRHFPRQTSDEVAKAIYGAGSEFGERWAKQRREELDEGRVDDVIAALRGHAETCEEARKDAEYFSTNRERMNYPRFRAMGLCVATGVVEGGCKHIVGTRLKRGGMRWTVAGANAIIALRCAVEELRRLLGTTRRRTIMKSHKWDVHPVAGWNTSLVRAASLRPATRDMTP